MGAQGARVKGRGRGSAADNSFAQGRSLPPQSPAIPGSAGAMTTQSKNFIERHGLWTDDERRQAEERKLRAQKEKLQFVRLAWADPHGASRAKAVALPAFIDALTAGYNI